MFSRPLMNPDTIDIYGEELQKLLPHIHLIDLRISRDIIERSEYGLRGPDPLNDKILYNIFPEYDNDTLKILAVLANLLYHGMWRRDGWRGWGIRSTIGSEFLHEPIQIDEQREEYLKNIYFPGDKYEAFINKKQLIKENVGERLANNDMPTLVIYLNKDNKSAEMDVDFLTFNEKSLTSPKQHTNWICICKDHVYDDIPNFSRKIGGDLTPADVVRIIVETIKQGYTFDKWL